MILIQEIDGAVGRCKDISGSAHRNGLIIVQEWALGGASL